MKLYLKLVYRFWSICYDTFVDPLFNFDRKKVIKHLTIKKKDKIIEIGVGTGLNLPYYSHGCIVTGVDFSEAMLKKAKEKNVKAKVKLHVVDARKLPFKDNVFNKALATYVLRVSPEPYDIMKELSRVVKHNGLFVILDQFRTNNILSVISQPFKLLLGWGKEYDVNTLLSGTSWIILKNKQFGAMKNTRLLVLQNKKSHNTV